MAIKSQKRFSNEISIRNRKAYHNYEFVDTLEVGLVLQGSEIKSIREGKVSLQEAHCVFHKGEMFVRSMNITPYAESTYDNHDPIRERKILLSKKQLQKFKSKSDEKGLAIIPTKLYLVKRGLAKMEIALAKGKKLHDKRESLKKKSQERELKQIQA